VFGFLYNVYPKHFPFQEEFGDILSKMSERLHVSTRYFFRILIKLEFSRQIFEKKTQIASFIKIRPVGAELFHADKENDRRT
jgi:hypothetical protein